MFIKPIFHFKEICSSNPAVRYIYFQELAYNMLKKQITKSAHDTM